MTFPDIRVVLGPEAISYSELATLGHCETKWALSYGAAERPESTPSRAMALGSEVHRLIQAWWMTGEVLASEDETAAWLIRRYGANYADNRAKAQCAAVEQPFCLPLPWGGWLFGWIDLVLTIDGATWLGEIKTFGRDNMAYLRHSRQLDLYLWAATQLGLNPAGILLDGILTQRYADAEEGAVYKSGPRKGQPKKQSSVADSFRREWITRTPEQINETMAELFAASMVRKQLRAQTRHPIKNLGQACSYCSVAAECLGETVEIVPED